VETPPASLQLFSEKERLYFMDWLRLLAILFVFFVHCSMPFGTVRDAWLIQFDQTNLAFTLFAGFTYQWVMHLFFFLAGAGTRFALASQAAASIWPNAPAPGSSFCFGSLAFTALQRYIALANRSQDPGPFLPFYLNYTLVVWPRQEWASCASTASPATWFLGYLFYAVLALPLLGWLHGQRGAPGWPVGRLQPEAGSDLRLLSLAAWSRPPAGALSSTRTGVISSCGWFISPWVRLS
jgi:hypothetical protein